MDLFSGCKFVNKAELNWFKSHRYSASIALCVPLVTVLSRCVRSLSVVCSVVQSVVEWNLIWPVVLSILRWTCFKEMNHSRTERTKCLHSLANMLFLSAVVLVLFARESSCVLTGKHQQRLQAQSNQGLPNYQELNLGFEQIKYSVADVSNEYNSTAKHHARGMGHLYFITKAFMNVIFPGELYPEGRLLI
ncbi:glomerular parietal epithelial cell differentiation [Homalodisca vitripennis]|nr:glomerular parietal epithelial cell differentiation [Homalodisca vitripennis]